MTDAKSGAAIKMTVVIRSAVLLLVAGPAAWAAGPPVGVYSCYDAQMDYKMRLVITPMPVVMFGIIDKDSYADFDGRHGHYVYDEGSQILVPWLNLWVVAGLLGRLHLGGAVRRANRVFGFSA